MSQADYSRESGFGLKLKEKEREEEETQRHRFAQKRHQVTTNH